MKVTQPWLIHRRSPFLSPGGTSISIVQSRDTSTHTHTQTAAPFHETVQAANVAKCLLTARFFREGDGERGCGTTGCHHWRLITARQQWHFDMADPSAGRASSHLRHSVAFKGPPLPARLNLLPGKKDVAALLWL